MATRPDITGAPSRANVIPFPSRGGTGFRAKGKWEKYNTIRLYMLAPKRTELIRVEESFTTDMIVAQAILAQLTPEQKRAAQSAVHAFYGTFGGDAALAASAFMGSL